VELKKIIFFMKMAIFLGRSGKKGKKFYFDSKSPLLDVGGFAKQALKKNSPKGPSQNSLLPKKLNS
jgi:hypothetical protein